MVFARCRVRWTSIADADVLPRALSSVKCDDPKRLSPVLSPPDPHLLRAHAPLHTMALASSSSYVCDTLPAARISDPASKSRSPSPAPTSTTFDVPTLSADDASAKWDDKQDTQDADRDTDTASRYLQPPNRKLCIRHQRMADEGMNLKLQQVRFFFLSLRLVDRPSERPRWPAYMRPSVAICAAH